nr:hypothetical protein [Mesorhizobium sp.]
MALAPETTEPEDGPPPGETRLKQAVVVVHGMGEQWPMSTLRSFVDGVWIRDPKVVEAAGHPNGARTWISPDKRTGSHELRRIVSAYVFHPPKELKVKIRTDFYELYWADLTQGNTRSRLYAWISELLWREKSTIPRNALPIYRATVVAAMVYGLIALLVAVSAVLNPLLAVIVAAVAALLSWLVDRVFLPYLGDVASYARATPETVSQRAAVRERGLELLRNLSNDPEYDRIVLVGHSLGSIIAYDLLQLLWDERRPRDMTVAKDGALMKVVRGAGRFATLADGSSPAGRDVSELRAAQWDLYRTLRLRGASPWKISDFVTVGSPLTHAEFLLAHDPKELRLGIVERLFSTSPPQSDEATKPEIRYNSDRKVWAVHHAACFAATRWTNIYDLGNLLWSGDPISGSLRENFGWGIKEFQVAIRRRKSWFSPRLFTHTYYWSTDADADAVGAAANAKGEAHLQALREALDLLRTGAGQP